MKYTIAVFTTRRDAMSFFDFLTNNGIYASIINTPREISTSCGISVKFLFNNLNRIKSIAMKYINFVAFYQVEENNNNRKITLLK